MWKCHRHSSIVSVCGGSTIMSKMTRLIPPSYSSYRRIGSAVQTTTAATEGILNMPSTNRRRRSLTDLQSKFFFSTSSDKTSTKTIIQEERTETNPTTADDGGGGKYAMPDMDIELKLAKIQNMISQHYKQGEYNKALKLSTDLFQQSQNHFGPNHPAVASSLNNMGLMEKQLGDFIEARRHYNAALRIYAKVVGRDHASYAMTLHNLASLNKAQIHFDSSLKATDRLSLVEKALDYFEEALAIRMVELGPDHPLTIATQSSLGTTLADQVLHQHRQVDDGDGDGQRKEQEIIKKRKKKYVSLNPESVTRRGWEAAEEYLRKAVQMAIDKPRGKSIHGNKMNTKTTMKKGKTKSGIKGSSTTTTATVASKESSTRQTEDPTLSTTGKVTGGVVETLSAASAAQNLAVFLKSFAMTQDPYDMRKMEEAKELYQQVLNVRSQLLDNPQHPDLLATKFSLAELLDVVGDEEGANRIRQEILDEYDPTEEEEDNEEDENDENNNDPSSSSSQSSPPPSKRTVIVEKTKAVVKVK